MNVTFSVQTEFDDIPIEVRYLLQAVQKELALASENVVALSETITTEHPDQESLLEHGKIELLSLHKIRLHMAKIDTRMEDCMAILGGYLEHIENPPDPEEEASEQEEENDEG
tara:strand:+ start:1385 stop:1723 length:339 start_codon:yes stop_codon:yes gene_type:complete